MRTKQFSRWARTARDADPENPSGGGGTSPEDPQPEPAKGSDRGYPENTPVAEMTAEQQAAYYKFHLRKKEDRIRELAPDNVAELKRKAVEFDRQQREQMTELEKAQAAIAEREQELEKLRREKVQRDALDAVNLSAEWMEFITATDADTAKQQAEKLKAGLAATNSNSGPQQGYVRGGSPQGGSVAAGRDLYAERKTKK